MQVLIFHQLKEILSQLAEVRAHLKVQNGAIHKNTVELAVLKATALRWDVIKISALVGVVVLVLGVAGKLMGLF